MKKNMLFIPYLKHCWSFDIYFSSEFIFFYFPLKKLNCEIKFLEKNNKIRFIWNFIFI